MDYKANSHKSKEEMKEKKVEKVISGRAKIRKKSSIDKMTGALISEDVKNVKSYILMDVLVPAIKDAVWNILTGGLEMTLFGEVRKNKRSSNASKISYRDYYDRRNDRYESRSIRVSRHSFDDIILDSRAEAEDVLSSMEDILDTYNIVSVADLYDLVGITGEYTDNKYGWTKLRNADVVRVRDGYMLKLPKPLPID